MSGFSQYSNFNHFDVTTTDLTIQLPYINNNSWLISCINYTHIAQCHQKFMEETSYFNPLYIFWR